MLLRTPIYLPDKLLAKARELAVARETTLTALIIEQLEILTETKADDSILMFSRDCLLKNRPLSILVFGITRSCWWPWELRIFLFQLCQNPK